MQISLLQISLLQFFKTFHKYLPYANFGLFISFSRPKRRIRQGPSVQAKVRSNVLFPYLQINLPHPPMIKILSSK